MSVTNTEETTYTDTYNDTEQNPSTVKYMKPEIGLQEPGRAEVAKILNTVLADEKILFAKTQNYHWNVVGRRFRGLHELFEEQYDELFPIIDDVAERVRMIGGRPIGTMTEFLEYSRLKEKTRHYPDDNTMIFELLQDHETLVKNLRQDIVTCEEQWSDVGSADFLTDLLQKHEEMAWFLRSHLEG